MTFASKALEPISERFFLVKLTPRRYLGAGTLSSGKYVFNITSGLNIDSITINGEIISSLSWTYSGTQLQITSALNLSSLSNVVTLDHNIFLTGTKTRTTSSISGIPDATWDSLIVNYPAFSQSMRNIAQGVFSLSNTSISFVCTDRWGQELVGKPDAITGQYESLSSAPMAVWVCIDSAENNRKIFDGEVSDVSYASGVLTLNVIDTFQKLNSTATFGTRAQSYIYTGNGTMYPTPDDENKLIPLCLGKYSPYKISPGYRQIDIFDSANSLTMPLYHFSSGLEATLIRPQNATQNSETEWIAGRVVGNLRKLTFGPVVGQALVVPVKKDQPGKIQRYVFGQTDGPVEDVTFYVTNFIVFYELSNINNFNGEIGDFIPASALPANIQALGAKGAAVANFKNNLYVTPTKTYNIAFYVIFDNSPLFDNIQTSYSQAATLPADNTFPAFSCFVDSNDSPNYEFEATETSLGPVYIQGKFNFFTNYVFPTEITQGSGYTYAGQNISTLYFKLAANSKINISQSNVKVRYGCQNPLSHGDALKFVINSAGMEANASSFTQADIDLNEKVFLTIPKEQNADFPKHLDLAQEITSSTLGILSVNESRQIEYKIIKNPNLSAADGLRDTVNMLNGQTRTEVQYQDIFTTIEFDNSQVANLDSNLGTGAKDVVDLPINRQIHRINKTKKIDHCLESIQSRKAAIAGYFGNPTVEYNLATANEDLASAIGDIIEINNTAVADVAQTTKGVIVGLDQSGSTTNVKINEIRGVD